MQSLRVGDKSNSAIRHLLDRLLLVSRDPLLHPGPDATPVRPHYALLFPKVLKNDGIASLTIDDSVGPDQEPDKMLRVLVVLAGESDQSTAFVDHAAKYRLMSGSSCFCLAVECFEESYHVQGQDRGVGVCAFGI